jgi:hypothetical protein
MLIYGKSDGKQKHQNRCIHTSDGRLNARSPQMDKMSDTLRQHGSKRMVSSNGWDLLKNGRADATLVASSSIKWITSQRKWIQNRSTNIEQKCYWKF